MKDDEGLFRALLEAAPDAMVIVDDAGVIGLVNAQTETLFGYTRHELLGQPIEMLIPERFRGHHPLHRHAYTGNQQVRPMGAGLDLYGLRKDGHEFPVEISLSPLETPDGLVVSAAVRDVSERKAAQQRFRALLEAAPDAMVIVDDTGVIRLVNAQTETLFGYTRHELLGQPIEILVPERFRGHHPAYRQGYAGNQQVRPMGAGLDLYGLRKDGHEFPVEISLSPLETPDGLVVSAAVRDVSERKAAEQQVNELALLVQSSHDAILVKTLDGTITFWNAAAEHMYGYTAAEAIGSPVSMLIPAGLDGELSDLLERLGKGEHIEHLDTIRVARDGRGLDVDVTLWPVRSRDDTIIGGCAIVRDIGERRRAERELTRLYEQQRHVALTLQRSLMGTPAQVPRIEAASRYLPATQGAGVGGDWFDLIALADGRIGVLIGDVMGRGLEAAAMMGQLRSAANALARTAMPPAKLLRTLDAIVADLPDQLVTCSYLVMDPDAGEVTICSAGHLPVLIVDGRTVRRLPAPISVPLGVGEIPHEEATITVPSGSTLVFYTDGLIESRGTDIETRLDILATALEDAFDGGLSLEKSTDSVLSSLLPDLEGHDDDVTLLMVRLPATPLATAGTYLTVDPRSVINARRFLSATLQCWDETAGCEDLAGVALLLTSEIVTNAIRHAQGPIRMRVHRTEHDLTVEVTDHSPLQPQPRRASDTDEAGRGLQLVEALADTWGTRATNNGKTVWFTKSLSRS
ncbi:PAS domain S-box protein [Actinocorallia longicatena]|uniref:SpoIIE family protein phosphatase n=1 Tax=Actinocorallia longicatena TaxID=111803 RepID=UPI0031E3DF8C